jgi:hypothetical protein
VGPKAGMDGCGKFTPTGIRSPDHPPSSESLYRAIPARGTDYGKSRKTSVRKADIRTRYLGTHVRCIVPVCSDKLCLSLRQNGKFGCVELVSARGTVAVLQDVRGQ